MKGWGTIWETPDGVFGKTLGTVGLDKCKNKVVRDSLTYSVHLSLSLYIYIYMIYIYIYNPKLL